MTPEELKGWEKLIKELDIPYEPTPIAYMSCSTHGIIEIGQAISEGLKCDDKKCPFHVQFMTDFHEAMKQHINKK